MPSAALGLLGLKHCRFEDFEDEKCFMKPAPGEGIVYSSQKVQAIQV